MISLLSFALAMLLATIFLPICRSVAMRYGMLVDVPGNARRVHEKEIPRSGGIAIFCGALIAGLVWLDLSRLPLSLLVALLVIAIFGLLDDLFDLNYRFKLAGQLIAASVFMTGCGGFTHLPFFPLGETPVMLGMFVSFLFLVGLTNAVNLSDGLDGLAAGNSLLSLGLVAFFAFQIEELSLMVITLSVAGGLVGFLRFNTHPATIFMGDMGSQFIGFVAGASSLMLFANDNFAGSSAIVLLVFGLPILDTVSVMVLRMRRGRGIFEADRSHLHHQFLRIGFRHYEVVTLMYGLQAVCVGLAYALRYAPDLEIVLVYLAVCGAILGSIGVARLLKFTIRDGSLHESSNKERRNRWLRKLDWYHRNTARVIAGATALLFFSIIIASPPAGLVQFFSPWVLVAPVLLASALLLFPRARDVTSRLVCYLASASIIYLVLLGGLSSHLVGYVDLYVGLMLLALILAIRVTRRNVFHLDTQDYLVVLLVAFAPFIVPNEASDSLVVRGVLYLAVIFYTCEYVLTKGNHTKWVLNAASLGVLVTMASS